MEKSTSSNGRRIAAAMFLGAASTAMVAGTAHADGVQGATVDRHQHEPGGNVHMTDDDPTTAPDGSYTTLIGLDVKGSSTPLLTYCIQKTVDLDFSEKYDEHAWSEETTKTGIDTAHLEGIKWILNNSYPQLDLGQLQTTSGVGALTADEAVEGTQAAIWNLSEEGKSALDQNNEHDANVIKLYNYLVGAAGTNMSGGAQPQASLSITGPKATPTPGSKVPFTLMSTDKADTFISVTLADANKTGAKLVDASGKAISATATFKSGDTVYVQLPNSPASGAVHLNASGTVSGIEAGRVFVSSDGKPSQNLILAQAQSTPVSASADVAWAPATVPTTTPSSSPSTAPSSRPSTPPSTTATTPSGTPSTTATTPATGGLAHTGAGDTVPLAGGALALLAAGGGVTVYTRRARKQSSHS